MRRSRPPVVLFNNTTFGLPSYDGISSMERDFLVSQYILDNYQPILDVQGQLIMLRDDLVSTAPPPPPLAVPPITTGLYFADVMACAWGDIPDFLDPPPPTEVAAAQPATVTSAGQLVSAGGWAFDSRSNRPAAAVLAVSDGVVVAQTQPSLIRPDVAAALNDAAALQTGWILPAPAAAGATVTFYALNADGTVTPLAQSGIGNPPATIRTVQGRAYRVVESPNPGSVDVAAPSTLMDMGVPSSKPLAAYQWLEFDSPAGFGQASIELTDQTLGAQQTHVIDFQTLPRTGHTVYLRVGSCIQWRGFQAGDLHLVVQGAPADMSVRLLP